MKARYFATALAASVALGGGIAHAADLEVTHWWTSGGEAAAVAELAKAFNATGNKWIDGAIAGGGNTARPIMVSRITRWPRRSSITAARRRNSSRRA